MKMEKVNDFRVLTFGGHWVSAVPAYKFEHDGVGVVYVHKLATPDGVGRWGVRPKYVVTEPQTGFACAHGNTRKEAIENFLVSVETRGVAAYKRQIKKKLREIKAQGFVPEGGV